MEEWKLVVGCIGLYEVSSLGNIRSVRRDKILKPKIDKYGYKVVTLSVNDARWYRTIHRLVAIAFVPNPLGKPSVNHINEDKLDNRPQNLEWVTVKENDNHGTRNKRMAQTKSTQPILQHLLNGETREWIGVKEAWRQTGINRTQISKCCQGIAQFAGGYKWTYVEVKN